jgi:hypothetical protein
MIHLISSPFELFATGKGYDITPAIEPTPARPYADRRTQELHDAWRAGAACMYQLLTEPILDTPVLRENARKLAGLA